nr:MAG TPA: hypothetical protein [Caudoviricetes sp.]
MIKQGSYLGSSVAYIKPQNNIGDGYLQEAISELHLN